MVFGGVGRGVVLVQREGGFLPPCFRRGRLYARVNFGGIGVGRVWIPACAGMGVRVGMVHDSFPGYIIVSRKWGGQPCRCN